MSKHSRRKILVLRSYEELTEKGDEFVFDLNEGTGRFRHGKIIIHPRGGREIDYTVLSGSGVLTRSALLTWPEGEWLILAPNGKVWTYPPGRSRLRDRAVERNDVPLAPVYGKPGWTLKKILVRAHRISHDADIAQVRRIFALNADGGCYRGGMPWDGREAIIFVPGRQLQDGLYSYKRGTRYDPDCPRQAVLLLPVGFDGPVGYDFYKWNRFFGDLISAGQQKRREEAAERRAARHEAMLEEARAAKKAAKAAKRAEQEKAQAERGQAERAQAEAARRAQTATARIIRPAPHGQAPSPNARVISTPNARVISTPNARVISTPNARVISTPDRPTASPNARIISTPERPASSPSARIISTPNARIVKPAPRKEPEKAKAAESPAPEGGAPEGSGEGRRPRRRRIIAD